MLAGMVRGRRRRVAPVIRREDEKILRAEGVQQVRNAPVEILQAPVEVLRVVPVPPEHVRLDEVDEDEPLLELAQKCLRLLDPVDVRLGRMRVVDVDAREDVVDLPHAVHLGAGFADERQVVRLAGPNRLALF